MNESNRQVELSSFLHDTEQFQKLYDCSMAQIQTNIFLAGENLEEVLCAFSIQPVQEIPPNTYDYVRHVLRDSEDGLRRFLWQEIGENIRVEYMHSSHGYGSLLVEGPLDNFRNYLVDRTLEEDSTR